MAMTNSNGSLTDSDDAFRSTHLNLSGAELRLPDISPYEPDEDDQRRFSMLESKYHEIENELLTRNISHDIMKNRVDMMEKRLNTKETRITNLLRDIEKLTTQLQDTQNREKEHLREIDQLRQTGFSERAPMPGGIDGLEDKLQQLVSTFTHMESMLASRSSMEPGDDMKDQVLTLTRRTQKIDEMNERLQSLQTLVSERMGRSRGIGEDELSQVTRSIDDGMSEMRELLNRLAQENSRSGLRDSLQNALDAFRDIDGAVRQNVQIVTNVQKEVKTMRSSRSNIERELSSLTGSCNAIIQECQQQHQETLRRIATLTRVHEEGRRDGDADHRREEEESRASQHISKKLASLERNLGLVSGRLEEMHNRSSQFQDDSGQYFGAVSRIPSEFDRLKQQLEAQKVFLENDARNGRLSVAEVQQNIHGIREQMDTLMNRLGSPPDDTRQHKGIDDIRRVVGTLNENITRQFEEFTSINRMMNEVKEFTRDMLKFTDDFHAIRGSVEASDRAVKTIMSEFAQLRASVEVNADLRADLDRLRNTVLTSIQSVNTQVHEIGQTPRKMQASVRDLQGKLAQAVSQGLEPFMNRVVHMQTQASSGDRVAVEHELTSVLQQLRRMDAKLDEQTRQGISSPDTENIRKHMVQIDTNIQRSIEECYTRMDRIQEEVVRCRDLSQQLTTESHFGNALAEELHEVSQSTSTLVENMKQLTTHVARSKDIQVMQSELEERIVRIRGLEMDEKDPSMDLGSERFVSGNKPPLFYGSQNTLNGYLTTVRESIESGLDFDKSELIWKLSYMMRHVYGDDMEAVRNVKDQCLTLIQQLSADESDGSENALALVNEFCQNIRSSRDLSNLNVGLPVGSGFGSEFMPSRPREFEDAGSKLPPGNTCVSGACIVVGVMSVIVAMCGLVSYDVLADSSQFW